MTIDPIALAALAKFNQNKNAKQFPTDVDPGTYPIDISFSLLGTLSKGSPGMSMRRDSSGPKHLVKFLLDHIDEPIYQYLVERLPRIRKGDFSVFNHPRLEQRINEVMPWKESPRAGSTSFVGELIIEDIDKEPSAFSDVASGLRIVQGTK